MADAAGPPIDGEDGAEGWIQPIRDVLRASNGSRKSLGERLRW
jgi:hypothetical protein